MAQIIKAMLLSIILCLQFYTLCISSNTKEQNIVISKYHHTPSNKGQPQGLPLRLCSIRQLTTLSSESAKNTTLKKNSDDNWQWLKKSKKLFTMSKDDVNMLLPEFRKRFLSDAERLKALAILSIGTPYFAGCLGEGKASKEDPEPIFRLDVTDCTVFILTLSALLHSSSYKEAEQNIQFANYRPLVWTTKVSYITRHNTVRNEKSVAENTYVISYKQRLHFTTDRLEVSPYFKNITTDIIEENKLTKREVVLNKIKDDGKRLIDIDWEKPTTIKYIPTKLINKNLLNKLPAVCGVAFTKEKYFNLGLDVGHEGLIVDNKTLVHASTDKKQVVMIDFLDYYYTGKENKPKFDGIILYEIR